MCDVILVYLQLGGDFFSQSMFRSEILFRKQNPDMDLCKNVWKTHFWGRFLLLSTPGGRNIGWNMMHPTKMALFENTWEPKNSSCGRVVFHFMRLAPPWSLQEPRSSWPGFVTKSGSESRTNVTANGKKATIHPHNVARFSNPRTLFCLWAPVNALFFSFVLWVCLPFVLV